MGSSRSKARYYTKSIIFSVQISLLFYGSFRVAPWLMQELALPWTEQANTLSDNSLISVGIGICWLFFRTIRLGRSTRKRLDKLNWERFEHVVADTYRRNGYKVEFRQKAGADGGIDFRAAKRGKSYIVQCKRWSRRVGVQVVREMAGLLAAERRLNGVIIVTNNEFTKDAVAFARGKSIELVNGAELQNMMRQ